MEIEAKSSVTNAAKPHYTKECGSTVALKKPTPIDLLDIQAKRQIILGIHDIYGAVYDRIGLTNPFSSRNQRYKAAEVLKEIVLARIANPGSKRAAVDMLNSQFGTSLKLDHVY